METGTSLPPEGTPRNLMGIPLVQPGLGVWICLVLIGVETREGHTDPPVSCPCAQPVMSRASSSSALWLSLWALSTPTTSLPRAVVSPQGASRPSPQRPIFLRVQPCSPCPPSRTLGVYQPCLDCHLPKGQNQLIRGCLVALPVPYLCGVPQLHVEHEDPWEEMQVGTEKGESRLGWKALKANESC